MAYKPRIETNNLDLTSILSTINELPEASKGVSLDVITAASLPATVVDNQITVITSTTPNTIYVDTNEPTNLVSGDLWVVIAEGDYGINFTEDAPYFSTKFSAAKQYNGSSWVSLSGYVGIQGTWQQFSYNFPAIGTPIAEWSWEDIIRLANSREDASDYFAVGDEKAISLSSGGETIVVIGAFNHNTITNGGGKKASIAFTFKNCLGSFYNMNSAQTNVGSWKGSDLCKTHMANVLASFPPVLTANGAIKNVDVVTTAGNSSASLVTSSERLRIHSVTELGLTYPYIGEEGSVYPYYAAGNRIKTVNGSAADYWTRSPVTVNATSFCIITKTGTVSNSVANNAQRAVPCFDI